MLTKNEEFGSSYGLNVSLTQVYLIGTHTLG